jgi:hypothetical protein
MTPLKKKYLKSVILSPDFGNLLAIGEIYTIPTSTFLTTRILYAEVTF